jgi:hypothetical protein
MQPAFCIDCVTAMLRGEDAARRDLFRPAPEPYAWEDNYGHDDYLATDIPEPAPPAPEIQHIVTSRYAPRPLWMQAYRAYRSGALTGTRWYRCLASTEHYRRKRRIIGMKYQFHAWPTHSQNTVHASDVRPLAGPAEQPAPAPCTWCGIGCTATSGMCPDCVDAITARRSLERFNLYRPLAPIHTLPTPLPASGRARYARPLRSNPMQMLRDSRMRPAALRYNQRCLFVPLRPRARTKHRLTEGTMHFLAARRAAVAQCIRRGFARLKTGVWLDPRTDVIYIQADVIYTCDNITRAVRYA